MFNPVEALINVLSHHAPDEKAEDAIAEMVAKARADGASEELIEKYLAMALVDGLVHGTWPWTT